MAQTARAQCPLASPLWQPSLSTDFNLRFQNIRQQQLITSGKQPVVIRTYKGSESSSYAAFQKEIVGMAAHNYFPTSQSWVPGRWTAGSFIIALLLCLVLIGILVFIYMLIVKPDGTLVVTYERRAAGVRERTCPRCAERIKAAALVCHFCGNEFSSGDGDEIRTPAFVPSHPAGPELPRKRGAGSWVLLSAVLGGCIALTASGIAMRGRQQTRTEAVPPNAHEASLPAHPNRSAGPPTYLLDRTRKNVVALSNLASESESCQPSNLSGTIVKQQFDDKIGTLVTGVAVKEAGGQRSFANVDVMLDNTDMVTKGWVLQGLQLLLKEGRQV
jgi:hypothetical protein